MKLLSVCSARPNFVKLAAVHHAFAQSASEGDSHVIVHTGQHYDPLLSDVFFSELRIPAPAENLGVHGGSQEEVIEKTKMALLPILEKYKPDILLAYGDVNGALGAAKAAKQLGIKVAHIESGLRSYDMGMPEEHNRIGIDAIADILFVTEQSGLDNLKRENTNGKTVFSGNTMIDTLLRNRALILNEGEAVLRQFPLLAGGKFAIATIHRPGNVDDPETLTGVMEFLMEVAQLCPIALPAHPRLKKALDSIGFSIPDDDPALHIIDPLSYFVFIGFMQHASFVLTDSGGIQEEAVLLKKRCFTLRRNTERPVTIESGSNTLIDPASIPDRNLVMDFARDPKDPEVTIPPMWDGNAGKRILVEIERFLSNA